MTASLFLLKAHIDGIVHWWDGECWNDSYARALPMSEKEAERRVRIINANNRYSPADERVNIIQEVYNP